MRARQQRCVVLTMIKTSFAILGLLLVSPCRAATAREYLSPDRSMVARAEDKANGQVITISSKNVAGVVCSLDLQGHSVINGRPGDDGYAVMRATWTPDSKFFVFSTGSVGGHGPWHWPTYVYGVAVNRFLAIDDIAGPVGIPDFRIVGKHTLETATPDVGDPAEKISIDLSKAFTMKKKKWYEK